MQNLDSHPLVPNVISECEQHFHEKSCTHPKCTHDPHDVNSHGNEMKFIYTPHKKRRHTEL